MYSYNKHMANLIVKSKWKLTSIEYNGIGEKPIVILANDLGDIKFVPLERGITNVAELVDLSKEEEE